METGPGPAYDRPVALLFSTDDFVFFVGVRGKTAATDDLDRGKDANSTAKHELGCFWPGRDVRSSLLLQRPYRPGLIPAGLDRDAPA